MANKKAVGRTLLYKWSKYLSGTNNLQQLIAQAKAKRRSIASRTLNVVDEGEPKRRIMNLSDFRGMTTGTLFDYTPGNAQPGVTIDEEAENLPILKILPPQEAKGKRTEFLESVMFFAILDNHMVITQTASLKALHLEKYLVWLLRDKAKLLREGDWIQVTDQLPAKHRGRKLHGVKRIILSDNVALRVEEEGATEDEPEEQRYTYHGETDLAKAVLDVLKAGKAGIRGGGPPLSDIMHPSNLEVRVELICKNLRKNDSEPFLDDTAVLARHLDDQMRVEFEMVGGAKLTPKDYRISQHVTVPGTDGMPEQGMLFEKMHGWLHHWIETKAVVANV